MTTLVAALAALTLAQAPAPAAPSAPLPTLTIDQALARALEANTDLAVARARVEQAKAGVWKAWSFHLPQVTAAGSWTHNNAAAVIPFATGFQLQGNGGSLTTDANGVPTGAPPYDVVPSGVTNVAIQEIDQLGGQLQVNQALIAPQAWFGIKAAYAGADAAAWSAETARREVLFGVAQIYYGVTSLKKLVGVSEELQGIAARQEKDAKVRLDAGTIAKVAYLRAQIDLARADQDLIRARNAYESARLALSVALVRDADFEVVTPAEPPLPADLAHLEEGALQARPDLKAARAGEDVAVNVRRAAVARYFPALGAFFRYQIANVGGFTGQNDSWAVGLGLSWTIFDGGLREAEIKESSARLAEAEATRRGLEQRIGAEVKQAVLDLQSAQANAVKAQEQAKLAEENQRLVDVSFRAGAATAVEQADATAQLRTAAIAATTEALQAQLAAVKLLKVAGVYVQGHGP